MATKRKLEIIIAGDAKGLNRTLGEVEGFGSKLSSKLKGFGKTSGVAFAAAAATAVKFGMDAVSEAAEAAKIGRLTDAVLKSTGGAANVTADQVSGLAESISNLTGIDDEAIQGGENMLLTFTKVRNEVGKGNDIFDQATRAAVDMSAALGTDVKAASMQMGKALNDPIKGVTALSRAGVSFTQQQKDQIKAMVESGDTLGAQKIILKEMSTQFGGAAEAAADPMQKLGVIVGNLEERVGTALLPIISKAATWLGKNLPKALDFLEAKWPAVQAAAEPVLRAVGTAVMAVARAVGTVIAFVVDHWPDVQQVWQRVTQAISQIVQQYWPGVQAFISSVMQRIRQVISIVTAVVTALWDRFGNTILIYARATWENIKRLISAAITIVRNVIKTVTSLIRGDWSGVWDGIKGVLSGVWAAIQAIVRQGITMAKYLISLGLDAIKGVFSTAWDVIKSGASAGISAVVDFVAGLPGRILSLAGSVGSAALSIGSSILHGIVDGISGAVGFVAEIGRAVANAAAGFINTIIDNINSGLEFTIPLPFGRKFTIDPPNIPHVPTFHKGGIIPGSGDTPIMALGGEGVIRPQTVAALAQDLFRARPSVSADARAAAAGGQSVVIVQVAGNLVHEQQLERWLGDLVQTSKRRGGALAAAIRSA